MLLQWRPTNKDGPYPKPMEVKDNLSFDTTRHCFQPSCMSESSVWMSKQLEQFK